ncbi:unannotated protein [freshwater metagenome]|uniref:Unannotated protein n=1 Tax=freshwater metagenome TaxID=449393 RepID=A0A6J7IZ02_9ZZZZ
MTLTVRGTGPRTPTGQVSVKETSAPTPVVLTSGTGLPQADSIRACTLTGVVEDWFATNVAVAVPEKAVPGVMVAGTSITMLPWS